MLRRSGLAAPRQVLKTVTPASATDSFQPGRIVLYFSIKRDYLNETSEM